MDLRRHAETGRAATQEAVSIIDHPPHMSEHTLQLPCSGVDERREEDDPKDGADGGDNVVAIPVEHTSTLNRFAVCFANLGDTLGC
jgi:hypothetical protein